MHHISTSHQILFSFEVFSVHPLIVTSLVAKRDIKNIGQVLNNMDFAFEFLIALNNATVIRE